MARKTWMTAAGVVGAVVIGGSALVAVATTGPSGSTATSSAPSASATSSPESTPSSSPTPEQGDRTGTAGSGQPSVTSAEAVEIARAELGMGADALVLAEIDLELEDGRQIWDVEFVGDHEVEVDSTTGEVVKVEAGDGRDDHRDDRGDDEGDDEGDDNGGDDNGRDDDGGHGRGSDDGPDHD
ncbi:MAG TPA: PepSY domain-containing protein [Jiangellaceae bacterium]